MNKPTETWILSYITHQTDGPVDAFVAIFRACEACSKHGEDADMTANILHEFLTEIGLDGSLPSNEY